MRLPYLQTVGFTDADTQDLGDLSVVFKVAFFNDAQTGNVLSAGLVVTVPTSTGRVELADSTEAPHAVLVQPYAGAIYNLQRVYFQGFSSIVLPLDQRDPTILFNSIATGWWLYREPDNRYLTAFVPVAELHLNTPLDHRSPTEPDFLSGSVERHVLAPMQFSTACRLAGRSASRSSAPDPITSRPLRTSISGSEPGVSG